MYRLHDRKLKLRKVIDCLWVGFESLPQAVARALDKMLGNLKVRQRHVPFLSCRCEGVRLRRAAFGRAGRLPGTLGFGCRMVERLTGVRKESPVPHGTRSRIASSMTSCRPAQ